MSELDSRIVSSTVSSNGSLGVVFYDTQLGCIVDDLTDYSLYLADDLQLDEKYISNICYDLRRYYRFLLAGGRGPADSTNKLLREFRDKERAAVMLSARSKNKERVANATVNGRLKRVYQWLAWLQETARVGEQTLGPRGCKVRSTLASGTLQPSGRSFGIHQSRQESKVRNRSLFPLLFRRTTSRSRHTNKFTPTEDARFGVQQHFHENASCPYLAHRNSLLIDIADTVGLRRESINSLTVDQFLSGVIQDSQGGFYRVTPSQQKFDYENSFDFPISLATRVSHFIENYLLPTASERGWKLKMSSSRIFLSYRSGLPIGDRSISKIVSQALRAGGAPRFAAIHSFRRKFTKEEIRDETDFRLREGLDTSAESVAASVSLRMGQANPQSIYDYVSSEMTAPRHSLPDESEQRVQTLEEQVLALTEKNRRLLDEVLQLRKPGRAGRRSK